MNRQLNLLVSKIPQVLVVFLFTLFIFLGTGTTINDIPTPLSCTNVAAKFYINVVNPDSGETELCYAGKGYILENFCETEDSEVATSYVVSAPDCSEYLTNSTTVQWDSISVVMNKNRVIGSIVEKVIEDSNLSETTEEENTANEEYVFDTVKDMLSADLSDGMTVRTLGYNTINDGGNSTYFISKEPTNILASGSSFLLDNSLYANLVSDEVVSVKQFGAVGNGTTDDYTAIRSAIDYSILCNKPLYFPAGNYYTSTMIGIDTSITLLGENKESTIIQFKDSPNYEDNSRTWQRGLFVFKGSGFSIDNLSFSYEAISSTPYTKGRNSNGKEGTLLSLLDSSNVSFNNVNIMVSGSLSPSITCVWAKSECDDITNIKFNHCTFSNLSESSVGGGLWLSAHDATDKELKDIVITDSSFEKKGHDEALGIWGHNVKNVNVENNIFDYSSDNSFIQSVIAIGQTFEQDNIQQLFIKNNTFTIKNNLRNVITVQKLVNSSTVYIENNTITASLLNDETANCICLADCGTTIISNNSFDITGGKLASFISFDYGGNVKIDKAIYSANSCEHSAIIKSLYSKNFVNAKLEITNSNFTISSTNSNSGKPVVQFPLGGELRISDTTISTNNSILHELVLQTLDSSIIANEYNSITLSNIITDAKIIINVNKNHQRSISIDNVTCSDINFVFPNAESHLSALSIVDCDYHNLKINYSTSKLQLADSFITDFVLK